MESRDYYEILQVDVQAEPEVIRAAYLSLARKYHPDVNRQPDAVKRMKVINEAYEVLSDPEARAKYDLEEMTLEEDEEEEGDDEDEWKQEDEDEEEGEEKDWKGISLGCDTCGARDADVRLRAYMWVFSLVIFSWRRAWVGVWCSDHSRAPAICASLLSLLLGIWGIPWGILWTLQAIYDNFRGGRQPSEANAALLHNVAAYQMHLGDYEEAALALADSLYFSYDPNAAALLATILQEHPEVESTVEGATGRLA